MNYDYDIAIIGSGFGGALLSMAAHRLGRSVLLLERGTHPRFAIGESTSPLTNLLLEQFALRYDLPRLLPLTTYGSWQRAYPEVVCGRKRGFTYFHQETHRPYQARPDRSNQLLVAASPNEEVSDTHWLRADVDHFLVKEAIALGVVYQDETQTMLKHIGSDGATLTTERHGQTATVRVRFVIDATGPRGFLSRALSLPETAFPDYPPTQTLFSHFRHVQRCENMAEYQVREEGVGYNPLNRNLSSEAQDTLSSPSCDKQENPTPYTLHPTPYNMDDAALHHIFDGGWMWVLPFNNGVTSAGIAVTDALAAELRLSEGAAAWERYLLRFPTVGEQFAGAELQRPFIYAPRLSYRTSQATGAGWAMLPSAAAFIDPLFSTGIPLTLIGIERLGRILEEHWDKDSFPAALEEYDGLTLSDADWTAQFIASCYAAMPYFRLFVSYSMFYFAIASYSEMARRLDRAHLARRFLGADRAGFAEGMRLCGEALRTRGAYMDEAEIEAFEQEVARSIAPLNIAGLWDPSKRNWYEVDMEDVIAGAEKLNYTPKEMRLILAEAPWAQSA